MNFEVVSMNLSKNRNYYGGLLGERKRRRGVKYTISEVKGFTYEGRVRGHFRIYMTGKYK